MKNRQQISMAFLSAQLSSWNYYLYSPKPKPPSITHLTTPHSLTIRRLNTNHSPFTTNAQKESKQNFQDSLLELNSLCPYCARRHFLGAFLGTALFPISPSLASDKHTGDVSLSVLNRIHPPRPDWYEEFYASAMDKTMKAYEAEIASYKSRLFANLRGNADRISEIGIGTGPNLKYYANYPGVSVVGVDPNRKMEKYARVAAGLASPNFEFVQAVAESLPLSDTSVDAVIGTLVLCSVKDVELTLQEIKRVLKPGGAYIFVEHVAAKDGTFLRLVQGVLDPLQQTVADGCHLTRNTARNIADAGFAGLNINEAVLSTASLINPHVYGIAYR